MIIGTGIDITLVSRMERALGDDAFFKKVFTGRERDYINSKHNRAETAAGIFCAKEAYLKAFGKGLGSVPLRQIEVLHTEEGAPCIACDAARIHVSISHMGDVAVAQVVAESQEDES